MSPKKLIEVSIPLEQINKESAREKSIRHSHPSTLHLWWARRPLAAARAVLWASLVDDPSEHPEKFPTHEAQDKERERLKDIIADFADWDNINNPDITAKALAELPATLPELLDPFAGGGSIPLEGQRLGLNVHAHDLNPIAVIINKAMIEIPPLYAGYPAIHPDNQRKLDFTNQKSEGKAAGLADDIKYYGEILKQKALSKIGGMYPKIHTPGGDATVIAWLWARTVKCPNPACGCDMPLASSFILSKKKGRSAWAVPHITKHSISFTVETSGTPPQEVKTGRGKFRCSVCGASAGTDYLHEQFTAHRDGRVMLAVVAEGKDGRLYLSPDDEQVKAADVPLPEDFPDGEIGGDRRSMFTPLYGLCTFASLFTNRQLTMLTAFADLIPEVREEICADARKRGVPAPEAYADAVSVYLAFVVDKMTDYHSVLCSWESNGELIGHTFTRQALPMIWDYAEANPFSSSSGNFDNMLGWVVDVVKKLPARAKGEASQHNAQTPGNLHNVMISTDPPYYDNIGYADLSDYFYIWIRRTLRSIYPELFRRVLVPKSEELVAAPYRHGGKADSARKFFEAGMRAALENMYSCASDDFPATIYYAYKQKKSSSEGETSAGWETMLNAVVKAGFRIIRTWPMRTERTGRLNEINTNSLASSIVLVCRKREKDAPSLSRDDFDRELREELKPALDEFMKGGISPVDVPQSAIGPGMAVYSKYSQIVSTGGSVMDVRQALAEINRAVDEILYGFLEVDEASKFCADMYRLNGFDFVIFDDANKLALRRSLAVDSLRRLGVVHADEGNVYLTEREELARGGDEACVWVLAQKLAYAMETGGESHDGITACAAIVKSAGIESAEKAKTLAYYLYTIADSRGWTKEAYAYNNFVGRWDKIKEAADGIKHLVINKQLTFDKELER